MARHVAHGRPDDVLDNIGNLESVLSRSVRLPTVHLRHVSRPSRILNCCLLLCLTSAPRTLTSHTHPNLKLTMPLPVPLANLSLWQRTVQSHPLLKSDAPLPESSDVVIIGGGMCGAVIAHALLHPEEHG